MTAGTQKDDMRDMLMAMGVVDELRRGNAALAQIANQDDRKRELRAKLKATYTEYGIDVTDDIIERGVEAIYKDQFVYRPAPETFAVRLARWYVARPQISRTRLLTVIALVLGAVLAVHAGYTSLNQGRDESARRALQGIEIDIRQVEQALAETKQRAANLDEGSALIADARQRFHAAVLERVESGNRTIETLRQLEWPAQDGAGVIWRNAVGDWRREIAESRHLMHTARDGAGMALSALQSLIHTDAALSSVTSDFASARPQLSEAAAVTWQLVAKEAETALKNGHVPVAQDRIARLRELLAGYERLALIEPALSGLLRRARATGATGADIAVAQDLSERAMHAVDAGDYPNAAALRTALENEVLTLESGYTLQITNRPGIQSGVWRYPEGNRGARNYYLIVEARNQTGEPVEIPVENEETGTVSAASLFGIRVPEAVYNAVKADKLDNGIVDRAVIGQKERGKRSPRYSIDVAGGYITNW